MLVKNGNFGCRFFAFVGAAFSREQQQIPPALSGLQAPPTAPQSARGPYYTSTRSCLLHARRDVPTTTSHLAAVFI